MNLTGLDGRARLLFYVQAWVRLGLVGLPVSVMAGVLAALAGSWVAGLVLGGGLFFLQFLGAVWMPNLAFERWGYQLGDTELLIVRGVLVRRVTAIPVGRVQHVDLRQGVLEQWLGLAHVQVYTASGVGADGIVPGLALDNAERLREALVAGSEQGDDGV